MAKHFNLYLSRFCSFSDIISLIVTLVAVSMLWSIFRLIRVASRVGGFNAFVSILDLEVVLQPAGSPVFCWPHLLPFPQQNQCRMRINWCQGLFILDTSCICGLCSTRPWRRLLLSPVAGRAELGEFAVLFALLFSKLANELQLQMVFFTGSCQYASHTARSRNCCFLQNEFSIYKICSDSGFHYVLACSAHATCLTCNISQISASPIPPLRGSADGILQKSARGALPLTAGIWG